MIVKIRAIEYNAWASVIKYITDGLLLVANDYDIGGKSIVVMPSYPKDMTTLVKPSIIVQKIHTSQSSVDLGHGFIGQHLDKTDGDRYIDVYSTTHDMIYQIDVNGSSNIECSIITSAVAEGVFDASGPIPLYDFITDENNPPIVGRIDLTGNIEITPMSSNDYQDYINIVRLQCEIVRTKVPNDGMVDLSKGIEITSKLVIE
jgi:hypothetical protein